MKKESASTNEPTAGKKPKYNPHAGHRERLRAKFDRDSEMIVFEDHEALEFHLSLVIPRKDTNALAHELLRVFGSLDAVLCATPRELFQVKNMTASAAYLLASEFAMVRKAIKAGVIDPRTRKIESPEAGIMQMYPMFIGRKTECSCILLMDINYRIIKSFFHESIDSDGIALDVADFVAKAAREGAAYVLFAHNHPSGDVTPSLEDIQMTERVYEALVAVGKTLIDHVIFSNEKIFSFHNNGLLDKYEDDLIERMQDGNLRDRPNRRKQFMLDLNEYLLTPSSPTDIAFKSKPKSEILDEYVRKCRHKNID